jgi:hypothetical protein
MYGVPQCSRFERGKITEVMFNALNRCFMADLSLRGSPESSGRRSNLNLRDCFPFVSLRVAMTLIWTVIILLLSSNNIFAQDGAILRRQAMDEEANRLMSLREKAMDEAVNKISAKKIKPQFFFILRNRAARQLNLNPIAA